MLLIPHLAFISFYYYGELIGVIAIIFLLHSCKATVIEATKKMSPQSLSPPYINLVLLPQPFL
jgi:hypothetical protein